MSYLTVSPVRVVVWLLSLGLGTGTLGPVGLSRGNAAPPTIQFPKDASLRNAKTDYGAKGDGQTDDTAALQKALDDATERPGGGTLALFLPKGSYLLSAPLVYKHSLGPWLIGESRDQTILKLKDGTPNASCVLRTHPNESGPTSADWFMRNLRNFTIDIGNNPQTDGIRYFATNTGTLQHVRVIGQGNVGINAGFLGQSGPNLIQDCEVDGCKTGLKSVWIWGQTLSRITLKNCREIGLFIEGNTVAAEDLHIENVPQPIVVNQPNDWYWWSGVLALQKATIRGQFPNQPAITNRGVLAVRDLQTSGYGLAIRSTGPGGDVPGPTVAEYQNFPTKSLFPENPAIKPGSSPAAQAAGQPLPIRPEPEIPWETDPARWLCANDYGVNFQDNQDDTVALQKALDTAAKEGKTVVYFRGCGGREPNWININEPVYVRGSVRMILGLGWVRILGAPNGKLVINDQSAPQVRIQNIDSFGGPPLTIEHAGQKSTLHIASSGIHLLGTGTGDVFLTDCPARLTLKNPGQSVWCRQLNPEGESDDGLVQNLGAKLWILGMKCEGKGIRIRTTLGGQTEVLGTFIYGSGVEETDQRPLFDVRDASLKLLGLREITFVGHTYRVKVRETRRGETRAIGLEPGHGWIGWASFATHPPAGSQPKTP